MIDTIIKLFFEKKKRQRKCVKTLITTNRHEVNIVQDRNRFYNKIKTPESDKTCLSGYFKNNKGLNYIERTKHLPIAVIEA